MPNIYIRLILSHLKTRGRTTFSEVIIDNSRGSFECETKSGYFPYITVNKCRRKCYPNTLLLKLCKAQILKLYISFFSRLVNNRAIFSGGSLYRYFRASACRRILVLNLIIYILNKSALNIEIRRMLYHVNLNKVSRKREVH
jgi:hypothetical protein